MAMRSSLAGAAAAGALALVASAWYARRRWLKQTARLICYPGSGMSPREQKKRPRKHELRPAKGRGRLRRAVVVLVGIAFLSTCLAAGLLFSGLIGGTSESRPKAAAIVDQLSLTQPNPSFAEAATETLEQAGYAVDYYSGEEVTVDFYRDLPTHGYDLLILRVHSGMARENGEPTGYVSLFTAEPFSDTEHYEEREAGRLGRAKYYDGSPEYFSIVPDFIEFSMTDRFDETTIILMGCNGLTTGVTAEAFVQKGAEAVIGWSGRVSAAHTDAATERLLEKLLVEGLPLADAVAQTAAEVGPDPEYGSALLVYPSKG